MIEGGGRLGQEGVADDAEADVAIERVLAGELGQCRKQFAGQSVQVFHMALGHHIEQMTFAQVVDAAILRGEAVDVGAEGLLYLAAHLITVLFQAVDQEGHPKQQIVQLVVELAGGQLA